jgi:hypothetical protein
MLGLKTALRRGQAGGWLRISAACVCGTLACSSFAAAAQTTTPGPTNPAPALQAKPGATIVVNPTKEECTRGWHPGLKWTKEQFEEFCTKLRASK